MEDIHKISGLTHRHPLAQSACGIYLAIAVRILDGYELKAAIWDGVYETLQWYGSHQKFQIVLDYWEKISDPGDLASLPNEIIYSGGYVVETMETVLWALMNTHNYRDCVLTCVNMGYDADSTAAIAGGMAGLYYGYDSIPAEWVDALVNKELIEDCIDDSKGCGGVMRVAPIGLYFGDSRMAPLAIDLMGADVAALTHGHEISTRTGQPIFRVEQKKENQHNAEQEENAI